VHGRSKRKPRLDFGRLARINEGVNLPLVIHGGTGLSDAQYHKLIDHGVAKINYYTALAEIAAEQTQANLQRGTGYRRLFEGVGDRVGAEVRRCMQVWRSAGRAAEVMVQCRLWQNVEHVIVFNPGAVDEDAVHDILSRGRDDLSRIPGVMEVEVGRSVNGRGKYRYCWLIRFAHEEVVHSYREHPVHVAYADKHFRPVAAERISADYEILEGLDLWERLTPVSKASA
jgi:fructose-bisphosphate aldolase class II